MRTCCETICKHRILFRSIQHLVWFPQGRPQGKQKCGKNSKNINLRRYFKFNREANCNTSIQTFMCTATLCNLCYIAVCCELLVYFSDKKSCNTSTTLQNSVAQFVSDSWVSCLSYLTLNNMVTLKSASEVTEGYLNRYHSKALVRFPIHLS